MEKRKNKKPSSMEGTVHIEMAAGWRAVLMRLQNGKLKFFHRMLKGRGNISLKPVMELPLDNSCDCSDTNIRHDVLKRLTAAGILSSDPCFFKIKTTENRYVIACSNLQVRARWIEAIQACIEDDNATQCSFSSDEDQKDFSLTTTEKTKYNNFANPRAVLRKSVTRAAITKYLSARQDLILEKDMDDYLGYDPKILCLKVNNVTRMLQLIAGFPFVLVIACMNLSARFNWLTSVTMIRVMNLSMYALAPFTVEFVLSKYGHFWQRAAIGAYVCLYLLPVLGVIMQKLTVQTSKDVVDGSTFCFKPARRMRMTLANMTLISGFLVDWIQHVFYTLPLGVITEEKATTLEELPPWISFKVYFWLAFISIIICSLTLILNSGLRGKLQYSFNRSFLLWLFYFNIGGSYFVSVVTIMFMGLWCDTDDNHDYQVLVQNEDTKCWSGGIFDSGFNHRKMAYCGLLGLAFFLVQMTLLPSGTFKETMTDAALDIVFVPVYLQMHMLLKAVFSGIYVMFYKENYERVITLTIINVAQLILGHSMQPCSIPLVNVCRDITFLTSVFAGLQSLNYIAFDYTNNEVKKLYMSSLFTNILVCSIAVLSYHYNTSRSQEYIIARAFLDLEWQVTRGTAVVNPRVLEPLIALTLSDDPDDQQVAKDHIIQMVWLISYPNIRVQFQSVWGLANVAVFDEDTRIAIHDAGGTATLFSLYPKMDFMVQLECVAALANLTLSSTICEFMVNNCNAIHFFLELAKCSMNRHADFAIVALGNIARNNDFALKIIKSDGLQILSSCFISSDYGKKRSACRALCNLAFFKRPEVDKVFESRSLLSRIVKLGIRNELETQLEVAGLLRCLLCRASLRPTLISTGVIEVIQIFSKSEFPDVQLWSDDMYTLIEMEVGVAQRKAEQFDDDILKNMNRLVGSVTWNSWGSKLDTIFSPLFSRIPKLTPQKLDCLRDDELVVDLAYGFSREVMNDYLSQMIFVVTERPVHGIIDDFEGHTCTYEPTEGYVGRDSFAFALKLAGQISPSTTVHINIGGRNSDVNDVEMGTVKGSDTKNPIPDRQQSMQIPLAPTMIGLNHMSNEHEHVPKVSHKGKNDSIGLSMHGTGQALNAGHKPRKKHKNSGKDKSPSRNMV